MVDVGSLSGLFFRTVRSLTALVVLMGAAESARANEDGVRWGVLHRQWSEPTAGIERVQIVHSTGDLRLSGGKGKEIRIAAAVQQAEDDTAHFDVRFDREGTLLRVTLAFENGSAPPSGGPVRRADVGISLPSSLALSVEAVDGVVELRDLEAPSEVSTRGGAIDFEGVGSLKANTDSGSVRAQFHNTRLRPSPAQISTTSGNITLELLLDAVAQVEVSTRGVVATDFSIDIEKDPKGTLKQGVAVVGEGGPVFRLDSERGDIRLRRLQAVEAAALERD